MYGDYRKSRYETAARWAFFTVALIIWAGIALPAGQRDLQVESDTDSWLKLAATTSNTTQIEVFLQNAVDGYQKHNIETGYYDPIAHTRDTDMSIMINIINGFIISIQNISRTTAPNARATAMVVFRSQYDSFTDNYIGSENTLVAHDAYWWSTPMLHLWQLWAWMGWGFHILIFLLLNHVATNQYEKIKQRRYERERQAEIDAENKAAAEREKQAEAERNKNKKTIEHNMKLLSPGV